MFWSLKLFKKRVFCEEDAFSTIFQPSYVISERSYFSQEEELQQIFYRSSWEETWELFLKLVFISFAVERLMATFLHSWLFMRNEFIFLSRPSNTSTQHQQTRMSTSDLRGVGISAPTGFVHVSGYSNRSGYRGSISESTTTVPVSSQSPQPMNVVQLRDQSNNRTSRMRELSNIDPKFTSQVSRAPILPIATYSASFC